MSFQEEIIDNNSKIYFKKSVLTSEMEKAIANSIKNKFYGVSFRELQETLFPGYSQKYIYDLLFQFYNLNKEGLVIKPVKYTDYVLYPKCFWWYKVHQKEKKNYSKNIK